MTRPVTATVMLALAAVARAANAQSSPAAGVLSAKDQRARELVVGIRSVWNGGVYAPDAGAGVIIAVTPDAIYVATARHVVAQREDGPNNTRILNVADSVWVRFLNGKTPHLSRVVKVDSAMFASRPTGRAMIVSANPSAAVRREAFPRLQFLADSTRLARSDYDLAVIVVTRDKRNADQWAPPELDRLGDVSAMRRGDDVTAIGCPGSNCWRVPAKGDLFLEVDGVRPVASTFLGGKLTFQTQQVEPGNSGGALFNENREVIGLVTDVKWPNGYALPIIDVVNLLGRSGVPIGLKRPSLPRDGYHLMVDVDVLAPLKLTTSADSLGADTRLPSARLTLSKRGRSPVTWHVGALRLAPFNTSIHAAMGGLGFTQRIGRLSLKPFAELGFGQVASRYDAGGYYRLPSGVTALPSPSAAYYAPLWVAERGSSAGFGAGMRADLILAPHVSVSANIARWNFGLTPKAPSLPSVFFGGGLRWSR